MHKNTLWKITRTKKSDFFASHMYTEASVSFELLIFFICTVFLNDHLTFVRGF